MWIGGCDDDCVGVRVGGHRLGVRDLMETSSLDRVMVFERVQWLDVLELWEIDGHWKKWVEGGIKSIRWYFNSLSA